jgi:hypothetical protein
MIPLKKLPEPGNFADNVTQKANAFLSKHPQPTAEEIRDRPYWRYALDDLHRVYNQICAYSALWCPLDMATVDHFTPISVLVKQKEPKSAYDWNNFRLASRSMNTEKHHFQDVWDPFLVQTGWFVMDFPSLMVKSGSGLSSTLREKVEATIKRLKLNEKEKYIEYRRQFLWDYCDLCSNSDSIECALRHLGRKAPFIAFELQRQELTRKIVAMMKFPKCIIEECDE